MAQEASTFNHKDKYAAFLFGLNVTLRQKTYPTLNKLITEELRGEHVISIAAHGRALFPDPYHRGDSLLGITAFMYKDFYNELKGSAPSSELKKDNMPLNELVFEMVLETFSEKCRKLYQKNKALFDKHPDKTLKQARAAVKNRER